MYTSEQIDNILAELGFDPADARARQIVEQVIASKPNVVIDQNFIAELRADLQQRAGTYVASNAAAPILKSTNNLFSIFMNRTLVSALVVIVVVVAGGVWYNQRNGTPLFQGPNSTGGLLSGSFDVKSVGSESFGQLDKVAIVNATDAAKLNAQLNSSSMASGLAYGRGAGMGGDTVATSEAVAADPTVPSPGVPVADKMIAPGEPYPGAVYYAFKYTGSASLPGLEAEQPVLKRSKPEQPASLVSRILNLISFGLIDLSQMQNVKMQNFGFLEDRDQGYGAYVDLQNGNVGMYQNYERWAQTDSRMMCTEVSCPAPTPLKPSELLPNDEAISIADSFLKDYSISREGYGAPRVIETWRIAYDQAAESERANYYIPEQMQVMYPLMLEGKEVLDESGYTYGMSAMVDVRSKKVTNLGELITKQFEKSAYKGETDAKRLISIAEQGGFRNYNYVDPNAKKVELELGAPTVQMVKIYYSSDNYKTNSDLYMPALVFPIKNWKGTNYWRQTVMVPLVKSILDTEQQPPYQILDKPIPVEPDGGIGNSTGAGSSGSAGSPAVQGATEPAILPAPRQ